MNVNPISHATYERLAGFARAPRGSGKADCAWYATADHHVLGLISFCAQGEKFCLTVLRQKAVWEVSELRRTYADFDQAEEAILIALTTAGETRRYVKRNAAVVVASAIAPQFLSPAN